MIIKDQQKIIRNPFLPLCLLLFFTCKTEPTGFVINGSIDGLEGKPVYFSHAGKKVDSTVIAGGKFSFKGVLKNPELCQLLIYYNDNYNPYSQSIDIPIFMENTHIDVIITNDNILVKGSALHDAYKSFYDSLNTFIKKQDLLMRASTYDFKKSDIIRDEAQRYVMSFITKRSDSFVSLVALDDFMNSIYRVNMDTVLKMFHALSANVRNSAEGKKLKEWIENTIAMSVGRIAPGFTSTTPEGKQLSLDEVKGKVTIIDFWASWCGPCRGENPNMVALYKKYHPKGLNIISVSLDDEDAKWKKAIVEDHMTWYCVSQLKGWKDPVARKYMVSGIPMTYVLDEKGVIVAKNLCGDELETKIAEMFGE